tara:strand:- start:231 stop:974 length:744 start_codon:yes stop_codon:yes gene_type:complete
MKLIFLLLICFPSSLWANILLTDSLVVKNEYEYNLTLKNTAIPLGLLALGFVGIESDGIQFVNKKIRNEATRNIDQHATIDDFLRHAPGAAVYVNNLLGIKGKHKFKDQVLIHATSLLIMSHSVSALKRVTHVKRPDGGSYTSFPSAHAALAFANAEFLRQEYKHLSPWYGISGYLVATSVGIFRVRNNKHWTTDVLAGAAVGILSTKIAYYLYERVSLIIGEKNESVVVFPHFDRKQLGLTFLITL